LTMFVKYLTMYRNNDGWMIEKEAFGPISNAEQWSW